MTRWSSFVYTYTFLSVVLLLTLTDVIDFFTPGRVIAGQSTRVMNSVYKDGQLPSPCIVLAGSVAWLSGNHCCCNYFHLCLCSYGNSTHVLWNRCAVPADSPLHCHVLLGHFSGTEPFTDVTPQNMSRHALSCHVLEKPMLPLFVNLLQPISTVKLGFSQTSKYKC